MDMPSPSKTVAGSDHASLSPAPIAALAQRIGREERISDLHGSLVTAIRSFGRPTVGTSLISCSDQLNGDYRQRFDRDLALPLGGMLRAFKTTNLAGRVEEAALGIALSHYRTVAGLDAPLVHAVAIVAHVGRRRTESGILYGEVDRSGVPTDCCGALQALVRSEHDPDAPAWLAALRTTFGERRLTQLRELDPNLSPVSTAIVHAVLQAESVVTELCGMSFEGPTDLVLLPMVIVNHPRPDGILLAGVYHVRGEGAHSELGFAESLRTTPSEHAIGVQGGRIVLARAAPGVLVPLPAVSRLEAAREEAHARLRAAHAELDLTQQLKLRQALSVRGWLGSALNVSAGARRALARPLLRGVCEALALTAPEVGVALFAVRELGALGRSQRLAALSTRGPSTSEARAALRQVEDRIQALSHAEALEVLELLASEVG